MTKREFEERLRKLAAMLDKAGFKDNGATPAEEIARNFANAITALQNRVDEFSDPTAKADLISSLKALETSFVQEFGRVDYMAYIPFHYALPTDDFTKVTRLYASVQYARPEDKLDKIDAFLTCYGDIIDQLQRDEFIGDDLAPLASAKKKRKQRDFEDIVADANEELSNIDAVMYAIKNPASHGQYIRAVRALKPLLKELKSTTKDIDRLKGKVGHIEPHQRSIKTRAEELIAFRNQEVADETFSSPIMQAKLRELAAAYQQYNREKTKAAWKRVKAAEKAVYGWKIKRRSDAKIDKAIQQRREIIADAGTLSFANNKEYRRNFNKTMRTLKRIDRKIIGRDNARDLYHRSRKVGRVMGGSMLVVPKSIANLDRDLAFRR